MYKSKTTKVTDVKEQESERQLKDPSAVASDLSTVFDGGSPKHTSSALVQSNAEKREQIQETAQQKPKVLAEQSTRKSPSHSKAEADTSQSSQSSATGMVESPKEKLC